METFQRPPVSEMIAVLEEVKIRIANFSSKYICLALEAVGTDFRLGNTAHYLERYINKSLEYIWEGASLECWILDHQPNLVRNHIAMISYRLAWIDWMLAGLKEELANENTER